VICELRLMVGDDVRDDVVTMKSVICELRSNIWSEMNSTERGNRVCRTVPAALDKSYGIRGDMVCINGQTRSCDTWLGMFTDAPLNPFHDT
jgi:hypothetical protein